MDEPSQKEPVFRSLGKAIGLLSADDKAELNKLWLLENPVGKTRGAVCDPTKRGHLFNAVASLLGAIDRELSPTDPAAAPFPAWAPELSFAAMPEGFWYSAHTSKESGSSLPLHVTLGGGDILIGLGGRRLAKKDAPPPTLQLLGQVLLLGATKEDGVLVPGRLLAPVRGRGRVVLADRGMLKELDLGLGLQPFPSPTPAVDALLQLGYRAGDRLERRRVRLTSHDFQKLDVLLGELADLAVFLLRRYIEHRAEDRDGVAGDPLAKRLCAHLFPLFGQKTEDGKKDIIAPFPLKPMFGSERTSKLLDWLKQFIPKPLTEGQLLNMDAPATFIAHLGALLFPKRDQQVRQSSRVVWVQGLAPLLRHGLVIEGQADTRLGIGVLAERTFSHVDEALGGPVELRLALGGPVCGVHLDNTSPKALGPALSARLTVAALGHEVTLRASADATGPLTLPPSLGALLDALPDEHPLQLALRPLWDALQRSQAPTLVDFFTALEALGVASNGQVSVQVQATEALTLVAGLKANELTLGLGEFLDAQANPEPLLKKLRLPIPLPAGLPLDLALELYTQDGELHALLSSGTFKLAFLPTFTVEEKDARAALALLLPLLTAAAGDVLKQPLGGVRLGQVLEWAELGRWENEQFTSKSVAALQDWKPLAALARAVPRAIEGTSLPLGPLTLKASGGGLALAPTDPQTPAVRLLEAGPVALDLQELGVGLAEGDAFKPSLAVKGLQLHLRGEGQQPLFEGGGFWLGALALSVEARLDPDGFHLGKLTANLRDLRLPLGAGKLVGKLLAPGGRDNPGLDLDVGWEKGALDFGLNGRKRHTIEIDRRIGPLDVERLVVEYRDTSRDLAITLDSSFDLAGLQIRPYGLGVNFLPGDLLSPERWNFNLDGLDLAFAQGGVEIAGLFRRIGDNYQGMALVSAFGYQLAAIGGYKPAEDGSNPSLFLFAALNAPLGGPPWFFVTGVAGGFGYNRALNVPDVAKLAELPFFALMDGGAGDDLDRIAGALDTYLPTKPGAFWLAAGVKFTCFSLIEGKALLYAVFGDYFEVGVVAEAEFKLGGLARVGLLLAGKYTTANNDPHLKVAGELTGDSFLIHEDCRLFGGFAFCVWFRRSDCVLTIGGYHPDFRRPEHYPVVPRLGFSLPLGVAVAKGECYCAITPRQAMAGARLEVSGSWGPVAAGFYAHFDALLSWDPVYFRFDAEIGVWLSVFGFRLEVGVGLTLFGPPFGGVGTLKCFFVTIQIAFGHDDKGQPDPLPVGEFVDRHLHIPQVDLRAMHVALRARGLPAPKGGKATPGLIEVEVERGRGPAPTRDGALVQPDGSRNNPIRLDIEFDLRLRSRIPLTRAIVRRGNLPGYAPLLAPEGRIRFNVCREKVEALESVLTVDLQGAGPRPELLKGKVPAALWADASSAADVVNLETGVGVRLDGAARLSPETAHPVRIGQEMPIATEQRDERFPLPIGWAPPQELVDASATLQAWYDGFEAVPVDRLDRLRPGLAERLRRTRAAVPTVRALGAGVIAPPTGLRFDSGDREPPPPPVSESAAGSRGRSRIAARIDLPVTTGRAGQHTSVYAGEEVLRVEPPRPIARRVELADVVLHRAPVRPPPPAQVLREQSAGAGELVALTAALRQAEAPLAPGQVWVLHDLHHYENPPEYEIFGDEGPMVLAATGSQCVRVLALGAFGSPVCSLLLLPGEHRVTLPLRTERLLVSGLGAPPGPPPGPIDPETGQPLIPPEPGLLVPAAGAVGVDADTPLVRIGDRTYAGPRCIVALLAGRPPAERPALTVGAEVLAPAEEVRVTLLDEEPVAPRDEELRFSPRDGGPRTLVIAVAAPDGDAPPVRQAVRWSSPDHELGAPAAVLGAVGVALLFSTGEETPWPLRVEVALSAGYRLHGVALLPGAVEEVARDLGDASRWDLVDDRLYSRDGRTALRLTEEWT